MAQDLNANKRDFVIQTLKELDGNTLAQYHNEFCLEVNNDPDSMLNENEEYIWCELFTKEQLVGFLWRSDGQDISYSDDWFTFDRLGNPYTLSNHELDSVVEYTEIADAIINGEFPCYSVTLEDDFEDIFEYCASVTSIDEDTLTDNYTLNELMEMDWNNLKEDLED